MNSRFFIDRPIFAWVIALFILVLGAAAITRLPVAQYPTVAPPSIVISTAYPGASAKVMEDSVLSVIEQELSGAPGLIYMEGSADATGSGSITATFEPGSDVSIAQIEVQNRLSRATPRLPASVTQQGVRVDKARSNFLMVVVLTSSNPAYDPVALADYAVRNIQPELLRVPGVGQAQLFASERAMRVWLDPAKLVGYGLSTADVNNAIRAQNLQISAGSVGGLPAVGQQTQYASITVNGQLGSAEQFGAILLRANTDGSSVRLKDVARIEVGAQAYANASRLNGQMSAALGIQLSPTGNALATANAIRERMAALKAFMPEGVDYVIPFDTSKFVKISIQEVVKTLAEAIALVFVVMLLFLQNIRYTLIPTIVVPVALTGTFAVMLALGYSINVLTLFGMVLAIGILVDDAIVVVENVERIMAEEGLGPREATIKAMGQITGAIIGITVVLVSVFVPMAFFSGSVGNIYRQFSVAMVASMMFSAFMALSLTPALCATLLKPVAPGHHEKRGFFGAFNRGFKRTAKGYEGLVGRILPQAGRYLVIYGAILAAVALMYRSLPTSFLPNEDQGYIVVNMQLPPGASVQRTEAVVRQVEGFIMKQPEVDKIISVLGFSFSGSGQNAALAFVPLKPWEERSGKEHSAQALAGRTFGAMMAVRDGFIFALSPPPIPELGNATGFTFRLQDRAGQGREALLAARGQLLGMAAKSPVLQGVRPDGLEDAPQLQLDIDRERAAALGVGFDSIGSVLATAMGSTYVNDFPNAGRLQRVVVQAEAAARMQPEDVLRLHVPNSRGQQVPLSAFASTRWVTGPVQTVRYNGYPAMKIAGDAAPGHSTGDAMAEMEKLAAQLPPGFGFEWTGQSREEKLSGAQATILLAFSMLAVFLCLSALYESWSIPVAVLLVVPLGIVGALAGVWMRGMPNDVYFKVGLITIIGLSAKNAILIIEFAKDLQAEGKGLIEATLEACHLRFRPILMTSFAFILGVLPLATASGAGSASQRAIGTGVMGGMITATVLAVFLVPVFFVVIRRLFPASGHEAPHATTIGSAATDAAAAAVLRKGGH
ncbi:efflux RND transporter permease subunit [Sphaerotilus microaerophilus]|uniref:Efflux pump membrane transporter n=1 Tax=Sphaerotilus microaerophilus TaxID=2914710 RepID=A0ABM7YI32_9BURK|nr:efflux RND transporter permease subunit [Sphaerotilus sp. FB-5]BDI03886.1 multidrug efflux RND transporter permease subunit [Sphaerotilus sp. FB-5]